MTAISTWRQLSKAQRYRFIAYFMMLDADQPLSGIVHGSAYLAQWLFEQQGLTVRAARLRENQLDLELVNNEQHRSEYARVYLDNRIPFNAIYDLLTVLKG